VGTILLLTLVGAPIQCMLRSRQNAEERARAEALEAAREAARRDTRRWIEPPNANRELEEALRRQLAESTRPSNPRAIAGRVHLAPGGPVPKGVGVVMRNDDGSSIRVHTDERGRFAFLGVPPGAHSLLLAVVARLEGQGSPWTSAYAGDDDVVLALDGRRTIRLTCEYPERLSGSMNVQVAAQSGPGRAVGTWSPVDTGGLVTDTTPGETYDVLVWHPDANLAALVENVFPDGAAFVPLRRGAAVEGRVDLPNGVSHAAVDGELRLRGLRVRVRLDDEGAFHVGALPGGTAWTLRFEAPTGEILPEVHVAHVVVGVSPPVVVSFR
jgi:hypothetical protein